MNGQMSKGRFEKHQRVLQNLGRSITKREIGEERNYILFTTNLTPCLLQRVSEKQRVSLPSKQVS